MKSSSQVTVSAAVNGDPEATRFARYGLAIPRQILKALENRGIYCQSSVSIEHQHLAKRYVLRATESGGAVADMGRYCAYLVVRQWATRDCDCARVGQNRNAAHRPHL